MKLLRANVGPAEPPLPANGQIELEFDRLLDPVSITRQTFVLEDVGMTKAYTPTISYDPVARVVTITPLTDAAQALVPQQGYMLIVTTPKTEQDPNGLRAIDGAPLESPALRIPFLVTQADPSAPPPVSIDFCRDIDPIFERSCAFQSCHGVAERAAAGLLLVPPDQVTATAVGRVAQGANTGPRAQATSPSLLFGVDMPIVDPRGDPSNSWMIYKLLMAVPQAEAAIDAGMADAAPLNAANDAALRDANSSETSATNGGAPDASEMAHGGDGGAPLAAKPLPIDVSHVHSPLTWGDLPSEERSALRSYVLGREMPFLTSMPSATGDGNLTLDELERVSLWIAQGAAAPASCP